MPVDILLNNDAVKTAEVGITSDCGSDALLRLRDRVLTRPVDEFLARPSKRFRAEVVSLSFQIAGGIGEVPNQLADVVEVLHTGSLIIDDVEDNSTHRRNGPTLHRLIGEPLAINAGNWMYFRALEILANLPILQGIMAEVFSRTTTTIRNCHEGQALDLGADVQHLQPQEMEEIVRAITTQKTGGLMAWAAWLGATAADGDEWVVRSLDQFGMRLGTGLQMLNDLAELRASAQLGGRCDDLKNHRVTWPWAWLVQTTSTDVFVELRDALAESRSAHDTRCIAMKLLSHVESAGVAVIRHTLMSAYRELEGHLSIGPALRKLRKIIQRVEYSYA